MVKCIECGTEGDGKFCGNCGAKLPEEDEGTTINKKGEVDEEISKNEGVEEDTSKKDDGKDEDVAKKETNMSSDEKKESEDNNNSKVSSDAIFCSNCGNKLEKTAKFCEKCGSKVGETKEEATETEHYNPTLAAVCSIIPGVGQVYNDQLKKGILMFVIWIVGIILSLFIIGIVICIIMWVYSIYDAYTSAVALNNGEILEDKLF